MSLNAFIFNFFSKRTFWVGFALFFTLRSIQLEAQNSVPKNEDEQRKIAEKYFEAEDYGQAYRYYSTLLANYPKEPKYNYRLGVCILFAGDERGDRKKAIGFLEFAKSKIIELEKEVLFYLGKAYHLNYRFDEAIKTYNEFKAIATSNSIKKLKVDREIQSAQNGKKLLSRIREMMVVEKKRLPSSDYFRSYEQSFYGGNLLVRPDDYRMPADMKKKDKVILFQNKDKTTILFSSYGESGEHGKDLYMATRGADGSFSKPIPLPGKVNTESDEDYPYLHPNEKHLFFCSKGHNSMGGYDIFKSEWDEGRKEWGTAVNLDFPINTPYDDIQFVTDSSEKLAIFSSTRISENGKIDVYKVNLERRPSEFSFISGEVLQELAASSKASSISIKDIASGENIGKIKANENGIYGMQLPNGGRFIFTVETPGFSTQSSQVDLPLAYDLTPYRQIITYENGNLVIRSFFDQQEDEMAYEKIRALLEEKMKMNVNVDELRDNPVLHNSEKDPKVDTSSVKSVLSISNENKKFGNKELLEIAQSDLKETQSELSEIKNQSENASSVLTNIKQALSIREAEMTDIENQNPKTLSEQEMEEKRQLIERLRDAQRNAQLFASGLQAELKNKDKEKTLQENLVKAMTDAMNSPKNKDKEKLLKNAEEELLKHQQNVTAAQKDDLLSGSKAEIESAEKALALLVNERKKAISSLTLSEEEIKTKKQEISETNDNELKESLTAELQNLQQEKIENEKNLRQVNLRISTTERELDNAVSQNNFIEKMLNNGLTESSDVSAILKIESKEDQKLNAENKFINNDSLNQVKNVKVVLNAEIRTSFSDSIDKISISESSIDEKEQKLKLLSEYSGLLDQQLKENKTKLKGKLNKNDKQEIQNEIKLIEKEIVMRKTEREDLSNLINKEKITDSKQNLNGNLDSVIVMNDSVQAEKLSNNEIKSANDSFLIKQEILVAQLTAIDTSDLKSSVLNAKMSSLKTYNALIDNKINLNKAEIKKEANKDERKRLEAENKELTSLKNKNSLAINEASKRKSKLEKDSIINSKQNITSSKAITSKDLTKNSDTIDSSLVSKVSKEGIPFENLNYNYSVSDNKRKAANENYLKVVSSASQIVKNLTESRSIDGKQQETNRISQRDSLLMITEKLDSTEKNLRKSALVQNGIESNRLSLQADSVKREYQKNRLAIFQSSYEINKISILQNDSLISLYSDANQLRNNSNFNSSQQLDSLTLRLISVEKQMRSTVAIDNKIELGFLGDSLQNQIIEKQKVKLMNLVLNNPEKTVSIVDRNQNTFQLREIVLQNEIKRQEVMKDYASVNENEFTALQKANSEARKKSEEKNSEEAKIWLTKSAKLMAEAKNELSKVKTEKDTFKKSELLNAVLDKQENAIVLQQKAKAMYEGGNPSEVDSTFTSRKQNRKKENSSITLAVDVTDTNRTNSSIIQKSISERDSLAQQAGGFQNEKNNSEKNTNQTQFVSAIQMDSAASVSSDSDKMKNDQRNSIDSVQFVNQTNSNSLIKNDSNGIIGPQDSVTNKNKAVLQEADVSTLKPESTDNNSFKRQVFTIRESNTYSDRNPIPMNAPFPDGIVYTVQVGAFKNPIPNSLFKGVSPVNGTKTESGFIRYQAGIFNELKEANTAKNQLRDMGFRDAFVVAYKNNQRISLSEIGNGSAISRSSNTQSVNPGTTDSVRQGANTLQSVVADTVAVKEVTSVGGLFFTVQIGIFGSTLNSIQSKNLEPITRYALGNGTYRYSAGVYNELERVKADRAKVQQLGISDAFIAAYFNGERISVADALRKSSDGSGKFEANDPIRFPGNTLKDTSVNAVNPVNNKSITNVFTNGVTSDPAPTEENGIKLNSDGIVYKVQIGAFSKAVPAAVTDTWMKIQNWPVRNYTNQNGLVIYTVGSFSLFSKAGLLLTEIIKTGVSDAFITVFKDGKRLYGKDAEPFLRP